MGKDPQSGLAPDALTPEQASGMLRSQATSVLSNVIQGAMFSLQLAAAGRSDDVRQIGLADQCKPQLLTNVGPSECFVSQFVLNGGKTNSSGQPECLAVLRHLNMWLCPKGHLARLLFVKYSVGKAEFPYPLASNDYVPW